MSRTRPLTPRLAVGVGAFLSLLLTGCFIADNDDRNPIIPAMGMDYPIKVGALRECQSDGTKCNRVELVKAPGSGYELRRFERNLLDLPVVNSTRFKMRALQGPGIPDGTFLVQKMDQNADSRLLALVMRQPGGRWLELIPKCGLALQADRLDGIIRSWLNEEGAEYCALGRNGLTDQRIYQILRPVVDDSLTSLFIEGA